MERFNDVYQFLLRNFSRDIMLEEVARICNMTPNAFCRYFKQKTQKTFTRFLNEIRIGHARKLLQNENYSIKDICYECGYNNPVNFFSFFKQITGQTPKAFRQNMK
jgi:AraC-like DNA-binding protein